MDIREIQAKSILVRSNIPGIDYVINPYIGCRFACKYCYASFMGRFVDKPIDQWGEYVYAKINAPEVLAIELSKLRNKGEGKEIFLSSVTDPYQGLEAKYKLTRKCLEKLVYAYFSGVVSILTKSNLVIRDIDMFKKLHSAYIGLTVTSTDDDISRYFETFAPQVSERLSALAKLHDAGLRTYAFIGPLLPHYVAIPKNLEKIFMSISETGTRDIFVEHINLSKYIRDRLMTNMKNVDADIIRSFYASQSKSYRQELGVLVHTFVTKYNMNLLTSSTIYHKEYQKDAKASRIDSPIS